METPETHPASNDEIVCELRDEVDRIHHKDGVVRSVHKVQHRLSEQTTHHKRRPVWENVFSCEN
jgi:hypothetical protein